MKYVYVLVSSPADLYYEQALMSAYSLRQHTPDAHITVLADDRTAASLTGNRSALRAYATEIISVPFSADVQNVERSRLIKTAIPDHVRGDFLYIDCDTIICGDLSPIDRFSCSLGGVLDGHVPLAGHIHKKAFLQRDKKLGFTASKAQGFCFNGGLLLARDVPETRALFQKWNELWKYSAYARHDLHDQSALNEANLRTGGHIQQLPGEWDCQPSHGGLAFLKEAKIIHYYSSEFSGKNYIPYYKLADKALQRRLKEADGIPADIRAMIDDPKFQFNPVHLVNDSRIVGIMQSPLTFTLADIQAHLPWLFAFWEAQAAALRGLGKRLKGKKG